MNLDDLSVHEHHPYPHSLSDPGNLRAHNKSFLILWIAWTISPHLCDSVWSTSGGCNYRGWRCGSDPRTARTFSDYEDSLPAIHRSTVATTWRTTYWSRGSNIHAFLTVLCHQRGREGEREYIGGCSSQSTGRSLSVLTNLRYTCLSSQRMKWWRDPIYSGHMQPARAEGYARIKMQILGPCNHEEAYSRVIIHAFDAGRKGRQKLLIRTVDTDILVLAIAYVESFDAQELWITFVTGKKVGYLAAQALGLAKH